MKKILEISANVAVLLIAGVMVFTILERRFVSRSEPPPAVKIGETAPLPDVDWSANGRTLVLVLQKGCPYCTESAAFYRKLVAHVATRAEGVHLIAVLPQSKAEAADYLRELGVTITDLRQRQIREMKVPGSPSLLLVGKTGIVENVWLGKLSPQQEAEVIEKL